jgi:acyl-coenzyme A thioesterase PaaI-like protein
MKTGSEYTAKAKVVQVKHRLIRAESSIVDQNEELIALASVKLIRAA